MQLYFEIIEGEQVGSRFQVQAGLSIGRKDADILLRDSKISGRHALIETRGEGAFYLVDNKSSNGLRLNGKRVAEVFLTPGIKIQVGRTILQVIGLDVENDPGLGTLLESWSATLGKLATLMKPRLSNEANQIAPFNPILQLKFLQGIQTGTIWTLGYGPRSIGTNGLDYQLEEIPDLGVAFVILPHRDGPIFQTENIEVVKLNGRSVPSEVLVDGDVIEIYKTRIQVILGSHE